MLSFATIDVETANSDPGSICQIGIVSVEDGTIVDEWESLVDPEEGFSRRNSGVHGIRRRDVRNAPTMPGIWKPLRERLSGKVVVCHTGFDRRALARALRYYDLGPLDATWLDSSRVVRAVWPEQYGKRGYNLANLSRDFGITFEHHDALEDSRAIAKILLRTSEITGQDIDDWLETTGAGPKAESPGDDTPEP